MKKISAYEIALSALACAIATVFLVLGTITPVLLFTGYLASCIALMLPLAKGSYRGYVLAYLGTGILAFLFCGSAFLLELLGFLLFFGLHPLFNELQLRFQMKKWLAFLIKAVCVRYDDVGGFRRYVYHSFYFGGRYGLFRAVRLHDVFVSRKNRLPCQSVD